MPHFTVHGTPFDCSFQIGKRFHREIRARLRHYRISPLSLKHQWKQIHEYYHYCQRHYPQYREEIAGLAEGSKTDFLELFYLNCPELSQSHHSCHGSNSSHSCYGGHGCSSIAIVPEEEKGKMLLAHNEDGEPGEKGVLITYQLPKLTFHSFVYHGELPGSAYNWNQYGLFFTVNYIPVLSRKKGAPYYFLTRKLVECPTVASAIRILKQSSCASGFHAYIGQGHRIISVEKWGNKTSIKEVKGIEGHTNHFLHPGMRSEVRKGSLLRLKRLQELLASKKIKTKNHPGMGGAKPSLTSGELLKILFDRRNRPYPLYSATGDESRTLSTVVFKDGKMKIYGGK